ncbi:MAG: ribbon-helix-helix protein, CopG family [Candidatus Korarchaeota archaeon]|nr:ribbon-helix-helix protein, CopG family [Candidatus Korarchaeota archaeon]NIU84855.1 ribbon-helix-helix protein, CopG family [Candidatus Thorarchaeota archaeon]NIW14476.1 ribbon-helix-helix protein, CopG family [Candidatus Thorarchaeota archaeon]NIW52931.1 ribbon-helix-helix protein, CopG family [Candidatus Korarchaeota archaeon]
MSKKSVSLRLKEATLDYLTQKAEAENLSLSDVIRRLLAKAIDIDKEEKAIEMYREGKVSLGRASEIADVSIWEMEELLKERGISLQLSAESLKEGLKNIRETWKKK